MSVFYFFSSSFFSLSSFLRKTQFLCLHSPSTCVIHFLRVLHRNFFFRGRGSSDVSVNVDGRRRFRQACRLWDSWIPYFARFCCSWSLVLIHEKGSGDSFCAFLNSHENSSSEFSFTDSPPIHFVGVLDFSDCSRFSQLLN